MTFDLTQASGRIQAKLELVHPTFRAYSRRIWKSPYLRELYPAYLRTMHAVVRSAVPLMTAAMQEARAREHSDPLCRDLAPYFEQHIEEERGHDLWLLQDIEVTGRDPAEATDQIPSPRVATMVGAQYYWIRHYHPVALLGHITAIEAYHPPAGFAQALSEATGYPQTAFRSIARHAMLDVHHRRDLFDLLDRLPLEPRHEKIIGLSGLHTIEAGIEVLEEIHAAVVRTPEAETAV